MFSVVKTLKNKNNTERKYLYICENRRDGKKVVSTNIACLGRIDNEKSVQQIKQLALSLAKLCPDLHFFNAANDIEGEAGKEYGTIVLFRHIWDKLKLNKILNNYLENSKLSFDAAEAIFSMVANRISQPASKLSMYKHWVSSTATDWDKFELQHFYRAMDFLNKHQSSLAMDIARETKRCFKLKVRVVMFDCTTILSYGAKSDILKHGSSKAKRMDLPQILVGLVMSEEGVPLGYEVWAGNKSEKVGFAEVLGKLKSQYDVDQVVIVCDRGMISKKNLAALENSGLEYILGVRMRQLSKSRQDILLPDADNFLIAKDPIRVKSWSELELQQIEQKVRQDNAYWTVCKSVIQQIVAAEIGISLIKFSLKAIQEFIAVLEVAPLTEEEEKQFAKRKYVVCYNPETAEEDKENRAYFQQIIENKLDYSTHKSWIVRNGYKKYLLIDELELRLDYQKLERESLFDGKWILATNTDRPSASIAFSYQKLWQIERHFRTLKSEIEAGPLRHWTEKRIKAHVCICFLALLLRTYLEKKLHEIDPKISVIDTIEELKKVQILPLEIGKQQINLRTKLTPLAQQAFKAVGSKLPPKTV